jgi:hypothetical protein
MIGHQQGYGDIFVEPLFVASGAFAAFAEIPVGEHIKIMVADSAAQNGFMQIVVEPHRRLKVLTEPSAFQIHDPFLYFFLLGPC